MATLKNEMGLMASDAQPGTGIPCCPELLKDDHCDVFNFKRILNYPVTVNVQVIGYAFAVQYYNTTPSKRT